jgi:hypothetical protein
MHADLAAASASLIEAAELETAAPSVRVRAARAAGLLLAEVDVSRAVQVLESAVRLLPNMAPRDLIRADQQHALGSISGLAADAAATALSVPQSVVDRPAARAVRLLEMGRAVLLSQALDTRSDLTELRAQHPALAARYAEMRQLLDQHTSAPWTVGRPKTKGFSFHSVNSEALDRRSIAAEFAAVVGQIRERKGFAEFGLPPELDGLLAEARQGPIVMFNVSDLRCDALVLTSDGITPVALPRLTRPALVERINMFYRALATAYDTDSDRNARFGAQDALNEILAWLWDNVTEPVLDTLGLNRTPAANHSGTGDWPRIWWVPGGLLGMLPIHASGHHSDSLDRPHRRTVLDRVVSSYTPTVRALGYARRTTPREGQPVRALIVGMPTTPGLPAGQLPLVPSEIAVVRQHFPDHVELREPTGTSENADAEDSGSNCQVPTRAAVLAHLPTHPVVHFACHGTTDLTDPSLSRLILHDHIENPLTVASLAPLVLDRVQLAYLSACQTAAIHTPKLVDEAIHLASAFHLAGYPHVIGTLWEISDRRAMTIADVFYAGLRRADGSLAFERAASALHHAVRTISHQRPWAPSLWAGYLHVGA